MNSWLFTRSDKSIYIVRSSQALVLTIYGPERARHEESFPDEVALQQYQVSMAEGLAASGWVSHQMNHQRRVGERRKTVRDTPDRRRASDSR